jgi:hypothetical protein
MIQQASKVKNVFISHPQSEDSDKWVREFADSLRTQGANVWFDETDALSAESYPELLEKALRRSDLFVFVVSPESVTRPSVLFEMGAALGGRKPLVTVVPDGFDPTRLPEPLRLRQHLVQSSPDETAHQIMSSISGA